MAGAAGVDLGEVPLTSPADSEPLNIPYNRSGTQIFQDNLGNVETEAESEFTDPNAAQDLDRMWANHLVDKNFYKSIEIAKDGGFSEVDELLGPVRYITGLVLVVFVFVNIWSLTTVNLTYIFSEERETIFLATKFFILQNIGYEQTRGDTFIIGFFELGLITVYIFRIFYCAFFIACPSGGKEQVRWHAVQELFWNAIPEASTISAVKLLNFVTPAVLLPELTQVIGFGNPLRITWFISTRLIAGFIGFDSLLFKLQANAQVINKALLASGGRIQDWSTVFGLLTVCLAFMNQFLGIVQVTFFVKRRIFAFIFAGEDGLLSAEEEALKETWESMLAQRIWRELPWYQALAVYLSYSDYDFQKLALETAKPGFASKRRGSRQPPEVELTGQS